MDGITSIEIENFRCFKKLKVEGLTKVNLIVGANNSGKTALLEAIEAVVSEDSPFVLYRASFERGEFRWRGRREENLALDIRHWFHGHSIEEGTMFLLRASGERERLLSRTIARVAMNEFPPFVPGRFMLILEPAKAPNRRVLPLTEDNLLGAPESVAFASHGLGLHPPVGFSTTSRLVPSDLSQLWSRVVLTPGEARTLEALRIIEPAIDRIAIAEGEGTTNAKVLLRGADGPIPLGTLGEGVARILALALHFAATQGGFLLIDEIELGLHWSVMPKLWRFLVETARALDVQVFATTHSKDCLEGLADLHRTHPALAEHVSVHRLEAGRETSVRFDAGRIAEYIEMELEAR